MLKDVESPKMSGRSGPPMKLIFYVFALLSFVYILYIYTATNGKLRDAQSRAESYRREEETKVAQLQDVLRAKDDLQEKCDKDRQEFVSRVNSLNQQNKMLKSRNDEMEADAGRQQQDFQKLKDDQTHLESQRSQEFQQLKQEKELEIASVKDQLANFQRQNEQLQNEISSLKAQIQNGQQQHQQDSIQIETFKQQLAQNKGTGVLAQGQQQQQVPQGQQQALIQQQPQFIPNQQGQYAQPQQQGQYAQPQQQGQVGQQQGQDGQQQGQVGQQPEKQQAGQQQGQVGQQLEQQQAGQQAQAGQLPQLGQAALQESVVGVNGVKDNANPNGVFNMEQNNQQQQQAVNNEDHVAQNPNVVDINNKLIQANQNNGDEIVKIPGGAGGEDDPQHQVEAPVGDAGDAPALGAGDDKPDAQNMDLKVEHNNQIFKPDLKINEDLVNQQAGGLDNNNNNNIHDIDLGDHDNRLQHEGPVGLQVQEPKLNNNNQDNEPFAAMHANKDLNKKVKVEGEDEDENNQRYEDDKYDDKDKEYANEQRDDDEQEEGGPY